MDEGQVAGHDSESQRGHFWASRLKWLKFSLTAFVLEASGMGGKMHIISTYERNSRTDAVPSPGA